MALTTPKMGLRVWDQLNDPYDHNQVADNWSKVDFHDHTPGRGVQIPTEGIADGAITQPKLAASLDPTPVFSTYKTTGFGGGFQFNSPASGGPFWLLPTFGQGTGILSTGSTASYAAFYVDPSDYSVTGRTVYGRTRVSALVNNVAAGATFTVGLYPVTGMGASGGLSVGTVVSGTTVALAPADLGASARVGRVSSDFVFPAAGHYALGVAITGTPAATIVLIRADLHMRQV